MNRPVMSFLRYCMPALGLCVMAVLMLHCTATRPAGGPVRIVHVKVVADPAITQSLSWRNAIAGLFADADKVFGSYAPLAFTVDTMIIWDAAAVPSYKGLLLGDCLVNEIPKGKSDLVVYFSATGNAPGIIAGMNLYSRGYAHVQFTPDANGARAEKKTFYSLIHWLAHMFGAVHVYLDNRYVGIMNPFLHEGMVAEAAGSSAQSTHPRFHPGNAKIMSALARRPFNQKQWSAEMWPAIRDAYVAVRKEYNPWTLGPDSTLHDYNKDAFHEGNLLLYLSTWASLCGKTPEALRYLDTVEILSVAITRSCRNEGGSGNARLCTMCGYDDPTAAEWLALQHFSIGVRRATVYQQAGMAVQADSCFEKAMAGIPVQMELLKDEYRAGFELYKSIQ